MEIKLFCSKETTDWPRTKYIIERGGDVNFQIEWNESLYLGSGNNYGRAIDFAMGMQRQTKSYDSRNFSFLFDLLTLKVIICAIG